MAKLTLQKYLRVFMLDEKFIICHSFLQSFFHFFVIQFFAPYHSLYLYIKLRKRYWIVEIWSCRKIQLKGWLNTSWWSLKNQFFWLQFFELCQISLYLHTKFLYSFIFPFLFLFFSPSSKANIMDKNAKRVWKNSMVFWIFLSFFEQITMKKPA